MVVSTRAVTGTAFARTAIALALGKGYTEQAAALAASRWPDQPSIGLHLRNAVGATTTETGVGAALVTPGVNEFVALVRARTIVGRLQRLKRVPFYRGIALTTVGAQFGWIGEGAPAPVGRLEFSPASLPATKAGGIVVLARELLEFETPGGEELIRDELVDGLVEFMDAAFVSDDAAVADVSPAGIANGVAATPSSGDPAADLIALLADFTTLDGVTVIMSEVAAIAIATAMPGALNNGVLLGVLPFVISSAAGDRLIAVRTPDVLYADDGNVQIDVARAATLEMSATPTNNSATPTPTQTVSLFQTNSVALKLLRFLNWSVARAGAVAVVSDATYGVES